MEKGCRDRDTETNRLDPMYVLQQARVLYIFETSRYPYPIVPIQVELYVVEIRQGLTIVGTAMLSYQAGT